MAVLILGGVIFQGFEIPSQLSFPMGHRHHIHYIVGGNRVIDAMGQDAQPRTWGGRFTGLLATPRARTLEIMSAAGRELPLIYGSFLNYVLITFFEPVMEKPYDIPYRITVTPTRPIGGGNIIYDAATALAGDISAAKAASDAAAQFRAEEEAP